MNDPTQRTETDERVAENQTDAYVAPVSRDPNDDTIDPSTGLPRGAHDDDASPLDRGKIMDPTFGATVGERTGNTEPSRAQSQAFASEGDPNEQGR